MSDALVQEIAKTLRTLSEDKQRRVLQYASNLKSKKPLPKGMSGLEMVRRFAGSIPKEDVAEMNRVIEEGCEQVDLNEW